MPDTKIKFIYWFAYYNLDSPSVRYRAQFPLDFLKRMHGIDYYLVVPGYRVYQIVLFLKAYFSALLFRKKNSIIVIQRVQSNFIYARLLLFLVKHQRQDSVYDLDDADYLESESKPIFKFVKSCHKISAGSREIKSYLSQLNSNVFHSTSPIFDLGLYKQKKNEVFTIGWVGGYDWGHRESLLEHAFPALKQLKFNFKLILISVTQSEDQAEVLNYFSDNENIDLVILNEVNWRNEREIQEHILKFDIGLATLLHTPVQRSKSGLKIKQYFNNGIPAISSNIPENNQVVINGYTGFLCDSIEDFKDRITQFYYMNDDEYSIFSENARNSIIEFNHSKYYEVLKKIWEHPSTPASPIPQTISK